MTRVLLATCILLAALCLLQWTTLRRLKGDLALVNYSAAIDELRGRSEEIHRVITWIDASAAGTQDRLCGDRPPHVEAVEAVTLKVYAYLRARRAGRSEAQARQLVVND